MENQTNYFVYDQPWTMASCPYLATVGSGGVLYPHSSFNSNFNWGDTYIGYSGPLSQTSNNCIIINCRTSNINVASNPTNGNINVYAAYSTSPADYKESTEEYYAGTDLTVQNATYYSNKNLFDTKNKSVESGNNSASINAGNHSVNFGFSVVNPQETGNPNSWSVTFYGQVIYGGTYNISK